MSEPPRPDGDRPALDDAQGADGRGGAGASGSRTTPPTLEGGARRDRSDWPVRVYRMGEEPPDRDYWLTRPVSERLAAGEDLRRRYYGADYDAAEGLPRLCRVVRRP